MNKRKIAFVSMGFGLIATALLAGETVNYKYDALGRLVKVETSATSTSYTYDPADNRCGKATTTLNSSTTPAACAGSSSSSSSSSSGGGNNTAPVCSNFSQGLTIPVQAGATTVGFDAVSFFTSHCTDANGDTLTLTAPTLPYIVIISAGQSIQTTYTVSDGNGGTGSAIFTVWRP